MGPNQGAWCPYKKRRGHRHTHKGWRCREKKATYSIARKEISEETSPANTLLSDSQPPEGREQMFLLFKPPVWVPSMAALPV